MLTALESGLGRETRLDLASGSTGKAHVLHCEG